MLLNVQHVTKSFGIHTILQNISFNVHKQESIGIVGPNGVGKSTLLRLLATQAEPDKGTITYAPSVQYGYLPQTVPPFYGRTINDLILDALGSLRQLEERMHELELAMSSADPTHMTELLAEYHTITTRFQDSGGYEIEHKIDTILSGLHLTYLTRDREVNTLSGGEKARLNLATLLLRSPDILLLDEPTNHLDTPTLSWLETYLTNYPGAILLVSHDRYFLNRTVTTIFELNEHEHTLHSYTGNYDTYLSTKAAERQRWQAAYELQQEEIATLRKYLRITGQAHHFHHASNSRDRYARYQSFQSSQQAVASNLRTAQTQLERLEDNLIPQPPALLPIITHFNTDHVHETTEVFSLTHLSKQFGERHLFHNLNLSITPNTRLLFTGENGAGKTTLFKIILGLEVPTSGFVHIHNPVRFGYLAQEPVFTNPRQTVLDIYRADRPGYKEDFINQLLSYGLLQTDDLTKQVGQLSIGQQRKLEIACLLTSNPTVLLLDEPTNYISLDVLEAFESAIQHFPGPVLAISHDRSFINRFGGNIQKIG